MANGDSERLTQKQVKYKAEDEANRNRVAAKNSLGSYTYNMKQTVEDQKLKGKISDQDKQKVFDKCQEVVTWLDRKQMAEKEEYEHKQKELEKLCNPIITKLYQGGAAPTGGAGGPTIEEVD
ncbi:heat shock 70 kDa protein-like [Malaclemys terrapin pileata]|uniref:heat shock 70 kDa protein-like n=1 Tax=Malaclemys terrapin pileata TaxID=2991368 RepID=UPI0023A88261|nr:heat shock 70 kDa protein-like [Malaclemys terrapin pileata]